MSCDAEALGRELLDVWNQRELDRFVALLDEEVWWYDPGMPSPPARGKAAVRAFADSVIAAFPDFRYIVREPVCLSADRHRCVFPWRIEATHSGWLCPPGFAPTQRRAAFDGVDVLECKNGKIVRIETCFDALSAAEQLLGLRLRPKPGSLRERMLVFLQRAMAARARRLPHPDRTPDA